MMVSGLMRAPFTMMEKSQYGLSLLGSPRWRWFVRHPSTVHTFIRFSALLAYTVSRTVVVTDDDDITHRLGFARESHITIKHRLDGVALRGFDAHHAIAIGKASLAHRKREGIFLWHGISQSQH